MHESNLCMKHVSMFLSCIDWLSNKWLVRQVCCLNSHKILLTFVLNISEKFNSLDCTVEMTHDIILLTVDPHMVYSNYHKALISFHRVFCSVFCLYVFVCVHVCFLRVMVVAVEETSPSLIKTFFHTNLDFFQNIFFIGSS